MLNQNQKLPLRGIGSILYEEIDTIRSQHLYFSFSCPAIVSQLNILHFKLT